TGVRTGHWPGTALEPRAASRSGTTIWAEPITCQAQRTQVDACPVRAPIRILPAPPIRLTHRRRLFRQCQVARALPNYELRITNHDSPIPNPQSQRKTATLR